MARYFKLCRKIVDGNPVLVKTEDGKYSFQSWGTAEELMPTYETKQSTSAVFKAAEDITVKSAWGSAVDCITVQGKTVFGWLDNLIKTGGKSDMAVTDAVKAKYHKAVEPAVIHTGIKAIMEEDEILTLWTPDGALRGFMMAPGTNVVDSAHSADEATDGEITFKYYNLLPYDVVIHKGDVIGQAVFTKVLQATPSEPTPEENIIVNPIEDTPAPEAEAATVTEEAHVEDAPATEAPVDIEKKPETIGNTSVMECGPGGPM